MKKYLLFVLFAIILLSVSCTKSDSTEALFIDASNPNIVHAGDTFVPQSRLLFEWHNEKGEKAVCDFVLTLRGRQVAMAENVTAFEALVTEEGNYTAIITPSNGRGQKRIDFKVNRLYEEMYHSDSGLYFVDDVSQYTVENYEDPLLDKMEIAYYKLKQSTLTNINDEMIIQSVPLNIVDNNGDSIPDSFVETDVISDTLRVPVEIITDYGTAVYSKMTYSEKRILATHYVLVEGEMEGYEFRFFEPVILAEVGLELHVPFARKIIGFDEETASRQLLIRERYDSEHKPVFSLEKTIETENDLSVMIKAENVARFAQIYDTRYLQLALSIPQDLEITGVDFGDLFDTQEEVSCFHVTSKVNQKILSLYKALLDGNESEKETGNIFATIHFTANTTEVSGEIAFTFEGNTREYGPLFRDSENRNVDGFIIDNTPLTFDLNQSSMRFEGDVYTQFKNSFETEEAYYAALCGHVSLQDKLLPLFESQFNSRMNTTIDMFISSFITLKPETITKSSFYRLEPVRNQSPYGSCWAFSAAASFESARSIQLLEKPEGNIDNALDYSERWIGYHNSTMIEGTYQDEDRMNAGSYLFAHYNAIRYGMMEEISAPYTQIVMTFGEEKVPLPPSAYGAPRVHANKTIVIPSAKTASNQGYTYTEYMNMIKTAIRDFGSLSVSYQVPSDFKDYERGIYTPERTNSIGGHAVTLIGWASAGDLDDIILSEKTKSNAQPVVTEEITDFTYFDPIANATKTADEFWIVKNSWGYDWGDGGYFVIPVISENDYKDETNPIGFWQIENMMMSVPLFDSPAKHKADQLDINNDGQITAEDLKALISLVGTTGTDFGDLSYPKDSKITSEDAAAWIYLFNQP